jgi:class I fructose-bisphosphate aldolase
MNARLNRLFAADGKCFDLAVDHGFFGERALLAGIEDMERAVLTLVDAAPDAIQLSSGQARFLQAIPGPRKPSLVLRTDFANVYGPEPPDYLFAEMIDDPVGTAVRLDAACVVANVLLIPGRPELHRDCVQNVTALRAACDVAGMPLMVEPLAMKSGGGGYAVDGDIDKIVPLVRHAVELGADVVKCDPTDELEEFHLAVEAGGGRPVLPRGGGKVADNEVLRRTAILMRQGAAGIVYGRNVIQHPDPAGMTRALMAVVHEGASADDALGLLASRA